MSHHYNFFTPEAEQAAEGDPDAFYPVSHQGFAPLGSCWATSLSMLHVMDASLL
jgi:hypothetical protein